MQSAPHICSSAPIHIRYYGVKLIIGVLLLLAPCRFAVAETLYAITYDGILLSVDETTGAGTQVRTQLPSSMRDVGALEFLNGYFYITASGSNIAVGEVNGGKKLGKFGFGSSDETIVGNLSPVPNNVSTIFRNVLARTPNNILYASYGADSTDSVGTINLSSLSISPITELTAPSESVSAIPHTYSVRGMTFENSTTMYMIGQEVPGGNSDTFSSYTLSGGTWNLSNQWFGVGGCTQGIAQDQANPNIFYDLYSCARDLGSYLKKIELLSNSSFTITDVGSVGFNGISGATWGPDIGVGVSNKLIATTSSNLLWMRDPTASDIIWEGIGHANNIVGLGATNGMVYSVTSDNKLWKRDAYPYNVNWTQIGTANNITTLAGVNNKLYAVSADNRLWERNTTSTGSWTQIGTANSVVAMTGLGGKLYCVTSDNKLWKREVTPNVYWTQIGTANGVVALGGLNGLLFASTSDNKLWQRLPTTGVSWQQIGTANNITEMTGLD